MNDLIITQAVKKDLPIILDIQRKAFLDVAKTFHLKSMPQIEQTLESLTDEFKNHTILKASLANISEIKHENAPIDKSVNLKKSLDSRLRGNDLDDVTIVGSVRAYAPGMNPKQTLKTDSAASHGVTYPPLCGIVQLTDSDELHSSESEFHNKKDTCYISRLIVLPEYQNRGIGKALMKEIENQFKNIVKRYELFTGSQDPRNLYLYNQLGYKSFKTEKYNEVISFVYMEKSAQ